MFDREGSEEMDSEARSGAFWTARNECRVECHERVKINPLNQNAN